MYGLPCPDEDGASLQGQRATVKGFRRSPSQLNGLKIAAGYDTNLQTYARSLHVTLSS